MMEEDLGIQVPLQFPQPLQPLPQIPFLHAQAIRLRLRQIQMAAMAAEARTAADIFQHTAVAATIQIQIPIRTHREEDQLGVAEEIHQQDTANVTATEVIMVVHHHQIPDPISTIC